MEAVTPIPKIRAGNEFTFVWAIERDGVAEDLTDISITDLQLTVCVGGLCAERVEVPFTIVNTNKIQSSHLYERTGLYNLELTYKKSGVENEIDVDAFRIVAKSAEASDSAEFAVSSDMAIAFKGDTGNGIQSIDLTSTVGLVKTYTITFTDLTTTTFTVTDGTDGHSPMITFVGTTIYVDGVAGVDLKGDKGEPGNGIQSITLLSTVGLVKTYRVTYTDNTTYDYTVTDGASTPVVQTTGASITDVMSQKVVTDELALKENTSNKQNSLATDGTGTKFPTVDAVNLRADDIESLIIRKLVQPLGATYNTTTKLYSLNGLTDITEAQMIDIYNYTAVMIKASSWNEAFNSVSFRTNIQGATKGNLLVSANYSFQQNPALEVFKMNSGAYLSASMNMFYNCPSLREVDFIYMQMSTANNAVDMFKNCSALVTCNLRNLKVNLSFAWSPLLSLASLQYLIQYRANGTTPITVTVHPTVFAKLTDNTNYPTWYAVNQDALTKYITFASA